MVFSVDKLDMYKCRKPRLTFKTVVVICLLFSIALHLLITFHTSSGYVSHNESLDIKFAQRNASNSLSSGTNKTQSPATCKSVIAKALDARLSDNVLNNIARLCLKSKAHQLLDNVSDSSKFHRVLSIDLLRQVNCQTRDIGPPEQRVDLVALASYAGSGSSWVRHLIEHVSGKYIIHVDTVCYQIQVKLNLAMKKMSILRLQLKSTCFITLYLFY